MKCIAGDKCNCELCWLLSWFWEMECVVVLSPQKWLIGFDVPAHNICSFRVSNHKQTHSLTMIKSWFRASYFFLLLLCIYCRFSPLYSFNWTQLLDGNWRTLIDVCVCACVCFVAKHKWAHSLYPRIRILIEFCH